MRPLPRLLRYAPMAWEGTLKLHFYLESILVQGLCPVFRPDMTKGRAAEVEGRLSYFFIAAKGLSDGNNLQHNTWRVFTGQQ